MISSICLFPLSSELAERFQLNFTTRKDPKKRSSYKLVNINSWHQATIHHEGKVPNSVPLCLVWPASQLSSTRQPRTAGPDGSASGTKVLSLPARCNLPLVMCFLNKPKHCKCMMHTACNTPAGSFEPWNTFLVSPAQLNISQHHTGRYSFTQWLI